MPSIKIWLKIFNSFEYYNPQFNFTYLQFQDIFKSIEYIFNSIKDIFSSFKYKIFNLLMVIKISLIHYIVDI